MPEVAVLGRGRVEQASLAPGQPAPLVRLAAGLLEAARREATAVRERAAADAAEEREAAESEAARILDAAAADGRAAAQIQALALTGAARREAAELQLAARRRGYEELVRRALAELVTAAATPRGQALGELIEQEVQARIGVAGAIEHVGPGGLGARTTTGARVAEVTLEDLVADAVARHADGVEELWQ